MILVTESVCLVAMLNVVQNSYTYIKVKYESFWQQPKILGLKVDEQIDCNYIWDRKYQKIVHDLSFLNKYYACMFIVKCGNIKYNKKYQFNLLNQNNSFREVCNNLSAFNLDIW